MCDFPKRDKIARIICLPKVALMGDKNRSPFWMTTTAVGKEGASLEAIEGKKFPFHKRWEVEERTMSSSTS